MYPYASRECVYVWGGGGRERGKKEKKDKSVFLRCTMSVDTEKWQRLPLDFQVHIQSNGYG